MGSAASYVYFKDDANGCTDIKLSLNQDGRFELRHELTSALLDSRFAASTFRGQWKAADGGNVALLTDAVEYQSDESRITSAFAPFGSGFVREANVIEPCLACGQDFHVPPSSLRLACSSTDGGASLTVRLPTVRVTSAGSLVLIPETRVLTKS